MEHQPFFKDTGPYCAILAHLELVSMRNPPTAASRVAGYSPPQVTGKFSFCGTSTLSSIIAALIYIEVLREVPFLYILANT